MIRFSDLEVYSTLIDFRDLGIIRFIDWGVYSSFIGFRDLGIIRFCDLGVLLDPYRFSWFKN